MQETEQKRIFEEWMGTHTALFFKVVRAYAFNTHDQEDLFQEIAFQVWNSIPDFRRESSATTWIYRVALYSGIAWSRKERRHRDRKHSLALSEHSPAIAPEEEDPRVSWLYEQIAGFDPIDRSLILLQLDGLSYREISETLGISENNVGVKINRIKKALANKSPGRIDDGL